MRTFLLFLNFLFFARAQQQEQYVTCNTSQGTVRGRTVDLGSSNTQLYTGRADVFTGIPYSQAPINQLRFEPPQPITTTSTTIYDATSFKPKCPQSGTTSPTSEDCLYLNVYTPAIPGTANQNQNQSSQMAVMIMIDGTNGFQNGGCDQSQVKGIVSNLVQRQIVVVTLQYRLGALGFFTTYTETIQSNLGMLDQVEAIKWVKTNIVNFGGDPNRITVAGQDDGACAVSAHTLSPLSQNLFQQAIVQSGSIYSCYNPTPTVPSSSTVTQPGTVPMYDQASMGNAGYQGLTTTTTTTTPSPVQSFDDPSQQLATTLCNMTWNDANLPAIQKCMKNYTVDFFVNQKPGGPTSTWMIVRDTSFLPGSLSSLSSRRPNIPIIIGTVQDEDADYAFKLINTGKADDADNLQNWIFDFARKNKLNATQQQNVANIISQNYLNGTSGSGSGTTQVLRDQPQTQYPASTTQATQGSQQIVYVNQFAGYQDIQYTSPQNSGNSQNVQYTTQNPQYSNQNQNSGYSQNVQYSNQNQNTAQNSGNSQSSQNVQYSDQNTAQNSGYSQNSQNVQYSNQNQNTAQNSGYSQNVQYSNNNQNSQNTQNTGYSQNSQNVQYSNQNQNQNSGYSQNSQNVQYSNQNQNTAQNSGYSQNSQNVQYSNQNQNSGYSQNVQRDQPMVQNNNNANSYTSLQTITKIVSDQSVSLTTTQIQDYMQNGDHIVRVYQFTHVSDVGRSTVPNTGDTWKPVFKGQDMYFITMSETIWTNSNYTAQDRQVANQMGQQWTDFVKTGQVQNWSPTTAQTYNYCNQAAQPTQQTQYGQQARQVFQDQINPICQQAQNTYAEANNLPAPYSNTTTNVNNNNNNPLGTVVSRQPANVQYSNGADGQNFHISFQVQGFPFNG